MPHVLVVLQLHGALGPLPLLLLLLPRPLERLQPALHRRAHLRALSPRGFAVGLGVTPGEAGARGPAFEGLGAFLALGFWPGFVLGGVVVVVFLVDGAAGDGAVVVERVVVVAGLGEAEVGPVVFVGVQEAGELFGEAPGILIGQLGEFHKSLVIDLEYPMCGNFRILKNF